MPQRNREQKAVIIDLSESNNAKEFDSSSLVHQFELKTAISWIDNRLQRVVSEQKERLHETMAVLGTRGSGKTSFLLSLIEEFKYSELQVMKIIDPTLIEEKGHVFLNVIASIKKLVEEKLDFSECNPLDSTYQLKFGWEKRMKMLADGLPSIDGIGTGLNEQSWQDSEYIMDRGIRAVSSAQDLEDNFHLLIKEGLNILKKKAFLIVFDDIDIDFKKGWPVLETIRKYFTSSQLITIISGELRLFSLAIRKNLNADLQTALNKNKFTDENIGSIITELEGQYLQKVIRPERRIQLTSLAEKGSYFSKSVLKIKTRYGEQFIEDAYNSILKESGINNPSQSQAFSKFMLGLPLRTQIRFFSLHDNKVRTQSVYGVEQAFISELYDKRVDVNKIQWNNSFLNIEILDLLIREKYLSEGYQLQPISENQALNGCLMALSLVYGENLKDNPAVIFDYFIRIGYVRNLLNGLGYARDDQNAVLMTTPSVNGLIKFSGMRQDGILRDITGLITAYMRGFLNSRAQGSVIYAGIIPLKALADPQKDQKLKIADRIDYVFKDATYTLRVLGYIPLTLSKYSTKNERVPCYSIYTVLATVSELLKYDGNDQNGSIMKVLQELSQVRTYTMPEFSERALDMDEQSLWQDKLDASNDEHDELSLELVRWKKRFARIKIAPYLLGKISTRFFYALESIQPNKDQSLGEIFHSQIVSFMNAVLIEDIKENLSFTNININNTVHSDSVLVNNLNKITTSQDKERLSFSLWMMSCPLLTCYLKPNAVELLDALQIFCREKDYSFEKPFSVFHLLDKVALQSKKSSGKTSGGRKRRIEDTISQLIERNAIWNWFQLGTKNETTERNKLICSEFPDIFGNDDKSSGKIREVREHIEENGIIW